MTKGGLPIHEAEWNPLSIQVKAFQMWLVGAKNTHSPVSNLSPVLCKEAQ